MYTILIPAFNEDKTIRKVVKIASAAQSVGQVLVIDDGSSDKTAEKCRDISPLVEIVSHGSNKGKGAAIRTGIALAKYECVVFIDADLTNITGEKIAMLAEPILKGRADFVKASFTRARGRVTEMAVKPMMQILFPDNYFEQPISGQFAARLSFLKKIKIVENWGLDIGILLDAISNKQRIEEVFIGELDHKAQSDHSLAKMSEQVLYTMIQKAGLLSNKYKLVLFGFDESLVKNYSLQALMNFIGKGSEFADLLEDFGDKELLPFEYYTRIAELLEGVPTEKVRAYAETLELRTYAQDIVMHLKRRKYKVGIVGMHFTPVVKVIADKLGVEIVESLGLKVKGKFHVGEMNRQTVHAWFSGTLNQGYYAAMHRAAENAQTDLQSVIAVASAMEAAPLLAQAGLSVAYRSRDKQLRKQADKTISILPEILMLVE